MLNHCLLSVDYSDEWDKVLTYLPAMTRLLRIRQLTLIYVVEVATRRHGWDTEETAARRLEALAPQLQQDLGISVDWKVRKGLPSAETLTAAKVLKANGVITLNRSHSSGREFFLGNTALNLARMTPLPLLILPLDGEAPFADAPVILATDCSRSAEAAHRQFITLIEAGAPGMVLTVSPPDQEPGQEPELEQAGPTATPETSTTLDEIVASHPQVNALKLTGHPVEEILITADNHSAALIILGKRGQTLIQQMPLGSIAEGVARLSRQPVLLVPG